MLENIENIDAVTIGMPFFGRVRFEISAGAFRYPTANDCLKKFIFDVSEHHWEIGAGNCSWVGSGTTTYSAAYDNIAMNTPIKMQIYQCLNGGTIYVEAATWLEPIPNTDNYRIKVTRWRTTGVNQGYYYEDDIGTLTFSQQTPLSCGTLPTCIFQEPNTLSNIEENVSSYNYIDAYGTAQNVTLICKVGDAGKSGNIPFHLPTGFEWNLIPCYNGETNKVNFPLSFKKNNIATLEIPFVSIYNTCPPSTGIIRILDANDMSVKLQNNQITSADYCYLASDICTSTGFAVTPRFKFEFVSTIFKHEKIHIKQYYDALVALKESELFDYFAAIISRSCNDYLANPNQVIADTKLRYSNLIDQFIASAIKKLPKESDPTNERNINSDQQIVDESFLYYTTFRNYLINHNPPLPYPNCASVVTNCNNFDTRYANLNP